MSTYTPEILWRVEDLLNVGIALSVEKDHNRLLEMILTEARKITGADAGTLYLLEGDRLVFKIMQNATLDIYEGGDGRPINLPPLAIRQDSVAGWVALTRESINIPDVNQAVGFNFSGPKRYEEITGYRNYSMLVVPLENQQRQVIGVLQLINAKNEEGQEIPFAPYFEKVISSLASQAAIALTNMQFVEDIENLLHSFLEVMATAIDARSPYNANHTRRVARMTEGMIQAMNDLSTGPYAQEFFDKDRALELVMAAWLHDIGKIATPLEVMDKPTRLAEKLELVLQRLDYIKSCAEVKYWKESKQVQGSPEMETWYEEQMTQIERARDLITIVNNPITFVDDALAAEIREIASLSYTNLQGKPLPWLTPEEVEALTVSQGTLTSEERRVMEKHVILTQKMLEKIPFPHKLRHVPTWAVMHHEFLDGTGYPLGLSADQIPMEGRILTLIDIFDALTAADRPYKKAMSVEETLQIIARMVKMGKLDGQLFTIFREQQVWRVLEKPEEEFRHIW